MRFSSAAALTLPLLPGFAQAIDILQANDDGWAEMSVRQFHEALKKSDHNVVLSCPAENRSGSSSLDFEPTERDEPCQFDSCEPGGKTGQDEDDARLNWVNSFPVTAMRFGMDKFGPKFFSPKGPDNKKLPDLAVSGPNVGTNLFLQVQFSGTVGSAAYAAHERGIPAIAFSGASTGNQAFDDGKPSAFSVVYAELATRLVDEIVSAGKPYLPDDVYLNVNFPKVEGKCTDASKFKWVLTRINPALPLITDDDAKFCKKNRLPTETSVADRDDCSISVSVGDAGDKTTADRKKQEQVINKIGSFFTCL